MSDIPDKPETPAKPNKKRSAGNKNPVQHRIPDARYAAARIIYESVPGMSYLKLQEQTGISIRSLENRAAKEGWRKNVLLPDKDMTGAAQDVADRYTERLADYGDEISAEHRHQSMAAVATELAVDLRGQVLDRHRKEWTAVRSLAYDSMKNRNFETAKLAKINSETLRNIQEGERKAWGLKDEVDPTEGLTIVVQRGDA